MSMRIAGGTLVAIFLSGCGADTGTEEVVDAVEAISPEAEGVDAPTVSSLENVEESLVDEVTSDASDTQEAESDEAVTKEELGEKRAS